MRTCRAGSARCTPAASTGWAQLVADGVKFVQKENITPGAADRWVFRVAPGVAPGRSSSRSPSSRCTPGSAVDMRRLARPRARGHLRVGALGTLMAVAERQQVRPPRRPARRRAAHLLRAADRPHARVDRAGRSSLSLATLTDRWSPWWMLWRLQGARFPRRRPAPGCSGRPSTCPSPTPSLSWCVDRVHGASASPSSARGVRRDRRMSLLFAALWLGGWHGPFRNRSAGSGPRGRDCGLAVLVIWVRVARPRPREDQLQRLAWVRLDPVASASCC